MHGEQANSAELTKPYMKTILNHILFDFENHHEQKFRESAWDMTHDEPKNV